MAARSPRQRLRRAAILVTAGLALLAAVVRLVPLTPPGRALIEGGLMA